MYIYTKRIDDKTLVVVRQNYGRCSVLMDSATGKRRDFTDFAKAKGKAYQLEQLGGIGAKWSSWMSKAEMDKRISARLDRALAASVPSEEPEFEIDDAVEAEWEAQFNRAFPENDNPPQPDYEVSEEDLENYEISRRNRLTKAQEY